jgi:hypothetical protein
VLLVFSSYYVWVRRGRDGMVVGCTSTRTFSAYQMNPKNINDWHSSATSRHCNPCSSWVAPWTYISFPIPVDICYFRSLLHHEDIPPLCRTFFGFQDELDLNISSETKEIDELHVLFFCLFFFSCIYVNVFVFVADTDIFSCFLKLI